MFLISGAFAAHVKRDQQCQDFIPSGYTIEGTTYDMHCNQGYNHSQYLQITYQDNLTSCINFCQQYDEPGTVCEGVQFDRAVTGAPGIQGHLCYLLWNTTKVDSTPNPDIDVALLRNATLPVI